MGFNLFLPCTYGAQVGAGGGELGDQAVGAIEGTVVGCKHSHIPKNGAVQLIS